ncbi:LuxR C-terminal-related transcriptional regulator [Sphaerisporangium viridialbum]|uniref:LuxR C-terminal-related transcriptional regulator n=1 Tax=Sphaerisporangium viridialbum TaxID=46189 RepID=UPI003C70655E
MAVDDQRKGMTSLRELLAEVVAGKGRIAMVTGAIATGKSELLYAFTERAFDHGALPLTATGSRAESGLPLGVLSQLVHGAPLTEEQRAATLGLLHEGARSQMSNDPRAEAIEHVDVQIVDALCTVLLELSERCPLVIAVDDVHYADRASQLCLAYLARRVKFADVMLVFSAPDPSAHLQSLFHTEVLRQPHCRPIRLAHLNLAGVEERVTDRAGAEAARRFAAECHALSGGNRLLIDALLEDHQATGSPGQRYGEAIVAYLRRADRRMSLVARGLAVLGDASSVGPLLGESKVAVSTSIQALGDAGVLGEGRFRHEIARSAVLAELDASERIALHRRAAELTYEEGSPPVVVAEHLLHASHAGDPWALSVLEEAARQALRDDGVESAIEYLKLAWRACGDERRRARIATALMRAEWRINPSTPAGHLAELTDALHKGYLGGGDAVVLAKALLWHGHVDDAREVLAHLKEREKLDQESAAELAAARPWFRTLYPSFLTHLPEVGRERTVAAASSLRVGRRMEAADALASVMTEGPREDTVATAELILRGSRLDEMTLDTVETALLALTYADLPGKAAPWCDAFIDEAESRRAPSRQARLSAIRAEIGLRRGDLAGAAQDAQRALELIPAGSWGVTVGGPLGSLLLAGAAMGKLDEYLQHFNQPVPEAMLETRYGLQYLHAKGRFNLMADQPQQALRDFRLCGELMSRWKLDVPGFIAWRTDAAEALIRLGEPDEAVRLVNDQLSRCDSRSKRAQGIATRLLASVSELRHRATLLRRSADLLQSGGDRYQLARTLFDLTEAYQASGEYRQAEIFGRRTRVLAQECHAEPLIRALSRGAEDDEPDPGSSSGVTAIMSDAERRVAALAAEGYTNREISRKLFITMSTVEQHLTRIYRKLNVTRRTELPARLADGLSAPAPESTNHAFN